MATFDVSKPHPQSLVWGGDLLPTIDTAGFGTAPSAGGGGASSAPVVARGSGAKPAAAATEVFVRVRPLIEPELRAGTERLPSMATRSSEPGADPADVVALESERATLGGYHGVLGPEADNADVFERFRGKLDTVARGGSASLFCYGYTGSGKSHTVLGYGRERGVYYLAAQALLHDLNE